MARTYNLQTTQAAVSCVPDMKLHRRVLISFRTRSLVPLLRSPTFPVKALGDGLVKGRVLASWGYSANVWLGVNCAAQAAQQPSNKGRDLQPLVGVQAGKALLHSQL
jgi:hypothetical protein